MKIVLQHKYKDIISVENILEAWLEFLCGKRNKPDVQEFSLRLMDNIFKLNYDLANHTYKHGQYQVFNIQDPKARIIHKAQVRDRLLHHAMHRLLYSFFDKTFIADSFSCRLNKGTHKALARFRKFGYQVSQNNTKTCWILKGDVKKFFASINQNILMDILKEYIADKEIIWLCQQVISSFHSGQKGVGLPLGNLTSQLFANIYLNQFDQFIKHKLKERHYIRYADDFVIFSQSYNQLKELIYPIEHFLNNRLRLILHPQKIFIKTLSSGLDFLGWVHFFDHRVLRSTTRRRMIKKIAESHRLEVLNSYLGLCQHGNAHKASSELVKNYFLKQKDFE